MLYRTYDTKKLTAFKERSRLSVLKSRFLKVLPDHTAVAYVLGCNCVGRCHPTALVLLARMQNLICNVYVRSQSVEQL